MSSPGSDGVVWPKPAERVLKTTHDALDGLSAPCVPAEGTSNSALPQILEVDAPTLPILPLLIEGVRLAVAIRAVDAEGHRQTTVDRHRATLMARLDLHSVANLVRWALRSGIATS